MDYHRDGFKNIPQTCQKFKNKLVREKDYMMEFLDTNVEPGDDRDYIKVGDLFKVYDEQYRGLQQNAKTKKTLKGFEESLKRCLGTKNFKECHQLRVDGRKIKPGRVFLKYRERNPGT